jgi:Uma2 family endonuclease
VKAPLPILVVEILSDATRRRDHEQKRSLYVEEGIPEYWIVDGDERRIRVVRGDAEDSVCDLQLIWHPVRAAEPFVMDVQRFFREALDGEIADE